MKHVGTMIGAAIAGIFVMSVWGAFAEAYGIGGGWFAGFIIISTMWTLNHYVGVINNDGAFVDMAVGIGVCGYIKDMLVQGPQAGIDSIPTLAFVIIGGILGGAMAYKIETYLAEQAAEAEKAA